jgi:DNA invertase Pin-like site-specific DNA recombinase
VIYETVEQHSKVIGMARRSTDEDRQQNSIEDQINQINDSCDLHHLILDKEFNPTGRASEAGIVVRDGSGLSFDREDFDLAIQYCKEHGVQYIVVTSLDRLSREEVGDFTKRIDTLRDNGIDLLVAVELPRKYDLSKGGIRNEVCHRAEYSHEVSRQTSQTTIMRKRSRAQQMLIPPKDAFGYTVDKGNDKRPDGKRVNGNWKIVPNTEELECLRAVGEMFIRGRSTTEMLDYLAERNMVVKSPRYPEGNGFTWQTLKRVLSNPIYTGEYRQFKYKSGKLHTAGNGYSLEEYSIYRKKGSARRYKTRMEPQPMENQTIIPLEDQTEGEFRYLKDVAIFTKAEHQKIIDRLNTKSKVVLQRSSKHLFAGFLRCGHCGGSLQTGISRWTKKHFLFCSNQRNGRRQCEGGAKTIDEDVLLREILDVYYRTAMDYSEKFVAEANNRLLEMGASDTFIELKGKLNGWKRYRSKLIDEGKLETEEFEDAERRLADLQQQIDNLSVSDTFQVDRYPEDDWSLTSGVVAALKPHNNPEFGKRKEDKSTALYWLAHDLHSRLLETKELPRSRELIADILDQATLWWTVRDGRKNLWELADVRLRVSNIKCGFVNLENDTAAERQQQALREHLRGQRAE